MDFQKADIEGNMFWLSMNLTISIAKQKQKK